MPAVFKNCYIRVRHFRKIPGPFGRGHPTQLRRVLGHGQGGAREEDVLLPHKIRARDETHDLEHGLNVAHAPKERRPRVLESHLTYISLEIVPLKLLMTELT